MISGKVNIKYDNYSMPYYDISVGVTYYYVSPYSYQVMPVVINSKNYNIYKYTSCIELGSLLFIDESSALNHTIKRINNNIQSIKKSYKIELENLVSIKKEKIKIINELKGIKK